MFGGAIFCSWAEFADIAGNGRFADAASLRDKIVEQRHAASFVRAAGRFSVTARYNWAQDLPGQQPTLDVGVRKDNRAVIIPPLPSADHMARRVFINQFGYTFAGRKGRGSCREEGKRW